MNRDGFTQNELRVLWLLKRRKSGRVTEEQVGSIYDWLADELGISKNTGRAALRDLERGCVLVRNFKRPLGGAFGDGTGRNPLLSVELVDPGMSLPPVQPVPLAYVVAKENRELEERTAHEPTSTEMLGALVDRCLELQQQIDKLQEIVAKLSEENTTLHKRENHKPPDHLMGRVREALTDEQWQKLRHNT